MPRPSNTAERREEIARAFSQVMAERGYEGASLADAARVAGLSPGLVHYHFHDKRDVLLATMSLLSRDAQARLDAAVERAGEAPEAKLAAMVDAHLRLGDDSDEAAVACWVAVAAEAVRDEKVRAAYRDAAELTLSRLEKSFGKALAAKHGEARGAKAAAAAVYAAIHGYFALAATVPDAVPRGSAAQAVRTLVLALVSREGGS
jgi:TetR/AcrR family transcriptional repressor of bet genes